MLELRRGEVPAAVELIRERIEMIRAREGSYAVGHAEAARVLASAGELGLLDELRSQDDFPLRRTQLCLATSGAVLAEAEGRTEEAAADYAKSADGWIDYGHRPETAFAELGAGRCLLELGRREDAVEALRRAREIFVELGAVGPLADVDDLLAVATAKTS
jgi:tetratricopeptide (TPR) repeat protein